jgi:hypothetical protein
MTISPKVGFWLSIILMLAGLITGFTTYFADFGLSQHQITVILDLDAIVIAVGNGFNAMLHLIPSAAPTTAANAAQFVVGPLSLGPAVAPK